MGNNRHYRTAANLARLRAILGARPPNRARYIESLFDRLEYLTERIRSDTAKSRPYDRIEQCAIAWSILEHAEKYPHLFGEANGNR